MKRPVVIAIAIAIIFGAACAAFGLLSPNLWNSPDETAVAFFSRTVAADGQMWKFEPTNLFGPGLIHPRSVISINANLVPGSFYGMMFYFAALYKVIGSAAFAVGTPLATALAGLVVFFFLRRLYDAKRALFGEILFFSNPGVWYFTSRGLFPNMLFLDLVIIGCGLLYLRPWRVFARGRGSALLERTIDDIAGLSLLGFAMLVRPVEFIWLAPILAVALWFNRKSLTWLRVIVGVIVFAAFIVLLLFVNKELYGGPWSFGYTAATTAPGIAAPALAAGSRLPSFISSPRPFILPFGFHPHAALTNVWNYIILFAWWLPLLAAIGLLLSRERQHHRRFGRTLFWTALVLGIYYGSGVFVDSSVSQWTIGSSYLRYFLPTSVLLVPLAVEGVARLAAWKKWAGPAALGIFVVLSAWTVYFRSPEALVPMHASLVRYEQIKLAVLKEVEPGGVIITERSDKIFFPDRRVMIGLRAAATLDELPRLIVAVKIYYYGITIDEKELPAINQELHARHLQLGRVKSFGNETLYSITKEN